ncbi:retrotransposon protein, putative, ty1-copia subclass [Tanacetum coccineum]
MVLGIALAAIIDRQLPFEYTITSRSTDVVVLVLRVEKKMFVIEQPIPPAPTVNSEANELKSMFEKQAGVKRFDLIQTFHACKHEEVNQLVHMSYDENYGSNRNAGYVLPQDPINENKGVKFQKANKKSLKVKGKGEANGKGKDKHGYISKPKNPKPTAKEHPAKDDTYHHCKEVGHWKRSCPVFLVEFLKKKKQGFREGRKLKQGALYLYVGNGVRVRVEAIGNFDLVLPNGLCFTDFGISVSKNNVHYFNAIPSNGIYEIDMHDLVPNNNSIYNVSTKRAKRNLDSTYLWHCRLAHISKKRIEKLQQEGLLRSTDDESFDQCVSCLSGKMTRKSFPHRPERATDLLGIIHTDVCGPLRHVSRQGASYFITFTDDYSRYGYVYLLKHKHEVFETFKVFKNEVENQLGKTIKALRSDRESATRILNMVPTKVDKTPYELWYGKVLNLSYLKAGVVALVKRDTPDKLQQRSIHSSDKWIDAMNAEMQSVIDNMVWVLVDLPPNCKTVGTKWLFKIKTDMDGNQRSMIMRIWQMDVKTAFLNGHLDEDIYMVQPEGFLLILKLPRKVCKLHRVHLSQSAYMDKILKRYMMDNSKRGHIPMQERLDLNKTQGASTPEEVKRMQNVPYASAVGSIMYAVRCTRPDVAFAQNITSRFQQNPGEPHWTAVKTILKYLRNTKDMFLVYGGNPEAELRVECYCDAGFETDRDDTKSQT